MTTKIERVSSMMQRYPAAHRAARRAYCAAYTAQALVRRPYQIRKYLRSSRDFTGLQIGAGHHQLSGWLRTDLEPHLRTVYMDATKRFPFADETFDYIVAEHVIEHVPFQEALKMLRECHRVLKSDGVIRITTPNIALTHKLMHLPLTPELERYVAWSNRTFGGTDNLDSAIHVVNRLHHEWGHRFLYDVDTLAASLRQSGFVKIAECAPNRSDHAGLINVDRHAVEIGEESNELESMLVEAIK
jgi:SAM-dependent methyltransferase